ncbi:glycosyltransferase family 4 protein [Chloroflexota bacterium]
MVDYANDEGISNAEVNKISKDKICMLTSGHPALDARIFHKESVSLQRAGYEVTVLAPLNKEGVFVDLSGNKIADGETVVNGIRLMGFNRGRERFSKTDNALLLLSLVNLGRLKFWREPLAELVDKGAMLRADVYHCHELWSLYAGIQIKKILAREGRETKLIYDVHEFRPAASSDSIKNRFLRRILRAIIARYEKKALIHTDYVITANQITRGLLLAMNRFIRNEVVYNCPIISTIEVQRGSQTHKDKLTICHEGTLHFNRGLKQMVGVMKVLKERYDSKVELLIVGDVFGKEREYLENMLGEENLHDVIRRTGWLPYERVGEAISQADVGIIFMEPTENNMLAGPPNKLFNYMQCGIPIVSVDLPETSRIIYKTQCGLIARDKSVESLAGALSALIDDADRRRRMGTNAKRAVNSQYSWEQMEKNLLRVYDDLLSKP